MESILQQKMEQFALEPAESDWQAIHDRLHPKKRRRFFWWILPVAGAAILAGAAIYNNVTTQPANNPVTTQENNTTTQPANNPIPAPANNLATQLPLKHKAPASETTSSTDQEKYIRQTRTSIPVADMPDKAPLLRNPASVDLDRWRPGLSIPSNLAYTAPVHTAPPKTVLTDSVLAVQKIPNKSTHNDKGWYIGAYAGLGRTHPFKPISGTKAMDLNSNAGNGGFSVYTEGSSNWKPGHHANLGLLIQKKNKKTEWSAGLGLQSNSWSQSYTLYKDSMLQNGSLYSRATVANPTVKYQQLAIELPLLIGFKLGGNQNNTWWMHTGLNNALVMQLRENRNDNTLASAPLPALSSGRADSVLKANTSSYLAQWQLGITYNHSGAKQHWQLRPYVQYGINAVTTAGEPDVNLFQWGLQWRYYFKKWK